MSKVNFSRRFLVFLLALLSAVVPLLFLIRVFAFSRVEQETNSDQPTGNWQTIFTDSFDIDFPGKWVVSDTNGLADGEYYWATTSVSASHGANSLWATGGGEDGRDLLPGSNHYPDNAASVMVAGPITVSKTQDLRLLLDVWLDTEPVSDTFQLGISDNGVSFTAVQILSGTLQPWQTLKIDLNERVESSQIWIMLSFYSNDSVTREGVFIDNLKLEGLLEEQLPLLLPIITESEEPTPVPGPGWLSYINQFRTASNLEPLTPEEEWSEGARLHSRYMVLNDYVGHYENPENQWYTSSGAAAAKSSNVFVTSWLDSPDETAIDFWMVAPFHAVSILDPQLKKSGFGSYREDSGYWKMAATLDVLRGRDTLPDGTSFPILYPPAGGQTQLLRYYGGEFPDPLASCPNYEAPTGLPIIIQLGPGDIIPEVLDHSVESNGQILESCLFDETSYVNENVGHQSSARLILNNRDAVVIIPRAPLTPGKSYTVRLTTINKAISWSFQTGDSFEDFSGSGQFDQLVK
ncbi:MAG: hypothetical protein BMS9Abin02_0130 [Anaerolineae bacterium]|nr:MAG: hypothetical protein BMS9Abin02_0130 [Anaerolineae bacterium]